MYWSTDLSVNNSFFMIAGFSLIWKNCCSVRQVLEMEQAKTLLKTTRDTEQRYAASSLIGECVAWY